MKHVLPLLEVLLFVIMFLIIQMVVSFLVTGIQLCISSGTEGTELASQLKTMMSGTFTPDVTALITISAVSSVLTLLVFMLLSTYQAMVRLCMDNSAGTGYNHPLNMVGRTDTIRYSQGLGSPTYPNDA